MENNTNNNLAQVCGVVEDELKFNHEIYGEGFYTFTLRIPRLSGTSDKIKVMVSDRLLADVPVKIGDFLEITGQFRSYNSYEESGNRLILTVFAKDIAIGDPDLCKNPNSLYLNGYVCKSPVYRTTPFGREITDILLAVNRTYNKSDYIPVIAWGRNARFCKGFKVGDNVKIWGRIQSRDYQKKVSEDETITKTAYEVSISKLELVNKDEISDEDSIQ
ncbi:MAG: single-stranded DNA-binding protein [Clostridia bacterium]|nr:single-stranded DNA-binding protein [Clostridia bacterium]